MKSNQTAIVVILGILVSFFLFFVNLWFSWSGQELTVPFGELRDRKSHVMVLGASVHGTQLSEMLQNRMDTTLSLYRAGFVSTILVSGDGKDRYYHETRAMKKYLLTQGVALQDVLEDSQGLNTFTSLYRAKHKFGLENFYVVSQSFHLPRVLGIARLLEMEVWGVPCDNLEKRDPSGLAFNVIREWLIRPQDFLKGFIL
jgi:vancomycin permeability regulator SanA